MKYIVVGASGFIGTYLVDELVNAGHDVIVTGRNMKSAAFFESRGNQFIPLDITVQSDFDKLPVDGVDGVVLLAALLPANVTDENPYSYVDVNINGTLNVLEYCRRNGIKKMISTTSYADVRNLWSKDVALSSDSPRAYNLSDDHSLYIITKNAATDIILYYNNKYDMSCSIFRLPPVYGVGPHYGLFINGEWQKSGFQRFIDAAMAGKPISIYGNKDVVRDIVFVRDVTQAFRKCLESDNAKGVYNIASGLSCTLEDQVRAVIEVFSQKCKKSEILYRPDINNNSCSYRFDISKAMSDFGYKPEYVPFIKLVEAYKDDLSKVNIEHLKNQYHD